MTTYENGLPIVHPRGYGDETKMDLKYENNVYIPVVPLDSLIDNFDKRVSVMKIDVEGFEYNVLFGACKFIEKHKPIIIIEIIIISFTIKIIIIFIRKMYFRCNNIFFN